MAKRKNLTELFRSASRWTFVPQAGGPFNPSNSPLVVNFGGGVDSTAILVHLVHLFELGDVTARPVAILFADVGAELDPTYDHVDTFSQWLVEHGFPAVTTVRRIPPTAPYNDIFHNMIANDTIPSEAYNKGACSISWKIDALNVETKRLFGYVKGHGGRNATQGRWADGVVKPTKLIGYDATETCAGKRKEWSKVSEDAAFLYRFPLVEWGFSREDCKALIAAAGVPVPIKSSCYFCPNRKVNEVESMAVEFPMSFLKSVAVEDNCNANRHGFKMGGANSKTEGLWRRTRKCDGRPGSWRAWGDANGLIAQAEATVGMTVAEIIVEAKAEVERLRVSKKAAQAAVKLAKAAAKAQAQVARKAVA